MLITLGNTDKKAIIDDKNCDRVMKFNWYWKKCGENSYYVATNIRQNGKTTTLYLHRLIKPTGSNWDVHHLDENTLNNREDNLQEQLSEIHRRYHLAKRLVKKHTANKKA